MWDGVKELMDEWEAEAIMNVARNLLKAKKFADEDIISATGLTKEQLNEIKME